MSDLSVRHDLLPARAVQLVAGVLNEGSRKYPVNGWRLKEPEYHINHAIEHILNYLSHPFFPSDLNTLDELSHAATRLLLALEVHVGGSLGTGDERVGPPPRSGAVLVTCPGQTKECLDPDHCKDHGCVRDRMVHGGVHGHD